MFENFDYYIELSTSFILADFLLAMSLIYSLYFTVVKIKNSKLIVLQ